MKQGSREPEYHNSVPLVVRLADLRLGLSDPLPSLVLIPAACFRSRIDPMHLSSRRNGNNMTQGPFWVVRAPSCRAIGGLPSIINVFCESSDSFGNRYFDKGSLSFTPLKLALLGDSFPWQHPITPYKQSFRRAQGSAVASASATLRSLHYTDLVRLSYLTADKAEHSRAKTPTTDYVIATMGGGTAVELGLAPFGPHVSLFSFPGLLALYCIPSRSLRRPPSSEPCTESKRLIKIVSLVGLSIPAVFQLPRSLASVPCKSSLPRRATRSFHCAKVFRVEISGEKPGKTASICSGA